MLKRELKINLKSFLIWLGIILSLFMIAFLVYPSIVSTNEVSLDEMLKTMPKEMLKMFNMDISTINNVFGWIKTEGYTFLLLISGLYSSILGSSILLKEESDKTIEYLYSKPISRNSILKSKILCGMIYIVSMIIIVSIFNYIGLCMSLDFDKKEYLMICLMPILSNIVLFMISLFISTFFSKTKKSIGISIGLVFLSYILMTFSNMSENIEFFKYISIYTLSDIRDIITNLSINYLSIVISISIVIISIVITCIRYNRKELV